MKTLNLVYPDKSNIKYKISKFPDGQQQVVIEALTLDIFASNNSKHSVEIISRLNNFMDLELILCATKALKRLGVKEIDLYVPYILGARSDRKFEIGSTSYLCDIIAPILNSQNYRNITVIDPHSHVMEAVFHNLVIYNNSDLVKWVLSNEPFCGKSLDDIILVSPDAGASHKIYKLAEQIGYKGDIITCSKERDTEGKLTKCIVPWEEEYFGKDLIIVDDICDGGATFVNISKELKELTRDFSSPKIYLIVTHGIFSKGFGELNKYFDVIYTTNSYQDLNPNDLSNLGNKHLGDFIKQLNIF